MNPYFSITNIVVGTSLRSFGVRQKNSFQMICLKIYNTNLNFCHENKGIRLDPTIPDSGRYNFSTLYIPIIATP